MSIELVECDRCEAPVPDRCRTTEGDNVCPECAQCYTECDRCGDFAEHTVTTDSDREICEYCAERYYDRCIHCDRYSTDTDTVVDGSAVCPSCVEDLYWQCDGCSELIDSGDYCPSCEDSYSDGCTCGYCTADLVHDYSYKPNPQFHGVGPLFLGAEVEINVPYGRLDTCAEVATSYLGGLGYLKEDGSIGHGFEIVTHPMAYPWAMDNFPWDMLARLRQYGCDATGHGLHVHVSRAGFDSPCHVYRWMKFLHRNASHVTTVARRVSNEWAAFDSNGRKRVKDYAKGSKGARYQAINTQNDDTFELRVFASSLEPQEVKAALALAAASVEYTRHLTVPDIARRHGWAWSSFVAWLQSRPEYAPLAQELEALACAC